MLYAERAFPFPDNPTPDHCQHMATREDAQRIERRKALAREAARYSPRDPRAYGHICNDRNARGAAAMFPRIDKAMRTQRPDLKEI